jgi:hypothetical protein
VDAEIWEQVRARLGEGPRSRLTAEEARAFVLRRWAGLLLRFARDDCACESLTGRVGYPGCHTPSDPS